MMYSIVRISCRFILIKKDSLQLHYYELLSRIPMDIIT